MRGRPWDFQKHFEGNETSDVRRASGDGGIETISMKHRGLVRHAFLSQHAASGALANAIDSVHS